ncbi:hypothetical protein [Herbiconiux sp. YIM B11900]|uniref:hypothetical protein n=1 Tax=Herbiconiux sp. YIM B11900 TaxID=3404131 RepID=UPI003F83EEB6
MTGAFGTAAFAADDAELPTSGPAFDALAQSLLTVDGDIQAVATDGAGNVVVYTTADSASLGGESRLLLGSAGNTVIKTLSGPIEAYAADEVVGGAGYAAYENVGDQQVGLCSVGFSGFTPEGDPAVISAGHCTLNEETGARLGLSALTVPSDDTAGGGTQPSLLAELGEVGFSQFGGPGDSAGTDGDLNSVDISTWDVTNDDLTLLPEVTNWSAAAIASDDLASSTVPVRSVGEASMGATISKSGRTTGFSTGTIQAVKGWANVSGHQVYGFGATMLSKPGDSGGSIIQGDTAIGVVSGGSEADSFVWGADLQAGLALTGGYTVAVKIDAPQVTFPGDGGDIYAGGFITGTGPAGTTLEVDPSTGDSFTVAIDGSGNWSFPAPATAGAISYSIAATQGFSSSPATTFDVDVLPAPLAAPVFTSPFDGQSVETSLSFLRGTGTPGATVTLTGDVEDTATVGSDGTWSVDVKLGYGKYTVSATQSAEGSSTSPAASLSFQVAPVAPAITDPKSGTGYDQGAGPQSVSGTGIDGATVTLWVNGTIVGTDTVTDGTWSIALGGQLAAGTVTITATQSIEGVASAGTTSTVTITAVNGGGGNGGGSVPAGNPGTGLANTGGTVAPLLGGGLALLLAAGGALLIARRTNVARRNS